MPKFRFILDIEAPAYTGKGDFPKHVHASAILGQAIQDAKLFTLSNLRKLEANGHLDAQTKAQMQTSLEQKLAYTEALEQSYIQNNNLVTEIKS